MDDSEQYRDPDRLRRALQLAEENDLLFSEEEVAVHPDSDEVKIGVRPISARGVPIPRSSGVVFVRARDESGSYWYVRAPDRAEETVSSEQEAVRAVLQALRRRYAEEP